MTSPQRYVVLVGTPCDAAARAHWDAVQSWADEHGWLTMRDIPATGDVLGTVPNMGAAETRRAIEAAA